MAILKNSKCTNYCIHAIQPTFFEEAIKLFTFVTRPKASTNCWLINKLLRSISPLRFLLVLILLSVKKVDTALRASSIS